MLNKAKLAICALVLGAIAQPAQAGHTDVPLLNELTRIATAIPCVDEKTESRATCEAYIDPQTRQFYGVLWQDGHVVEIRKFIPGKPYQVVYSNGVLGLGV